MTIEDVLTIKTRGEVAEKLTDPPSVLDEIPTYKEFFTNQELYERIHVHLVGVRTQKNKKGGLKSKGIFGLPSVYKSVSASVNVGTYGKSGSTEYFPIGKHSFLPVTKSDLPIWDAKAMVISKKGIENTEGIKLSVVNDGSTLFETTLESKDFPAAGEGWKEYVHTPPNSSCVKDIEFVYRIRITGCEDKIVSKDDLASFLADSSTLSYSEEVIEGETKANNALVQCWRHKNSSEGSKAVLWFLGRNDCFMHPHVAKALFTEQGYDLYVLNYSMDGMCRKRGWVEDADFNSHNFTGSFDIYDAQIKGATDLIKSSKNYEKLVGYAHSTGGPVLFNYLMKAGDGEFDGFIFNSPFLDWSADAVGGELFEYIIEHLNIPAKLGLRSNDTKMGSPVTPEELKDTPVKYLGTEIEMSAWAAKVWSQYFFDFRCRPAYTVPMTIGFASAVTGVHTKLLKWQKEKKYVTLKPFMCITSRADDTLTASETLTLIDLIGPARCEFELRHNAHDVFLSEEKSDVEMAVNLTKYWMKGNGFA